MKAENVSVRLSRIMADQNLKQVDILEKARPFCEQFGVTLGRNDLSQYVSGKVEPGKEKLKILSLALDVSEAWIMGYNTTKDPEGLYTCPVCGLRYDRSYSEDVQYHEEIHKEFLLANSYFGVLMTREEMGIAKSKAYDILGSNQYSEDEKYSAAIKLIESYFSRSLYANQLKHSHPPFNKYVAMLVNNEEWKETFSEPIYQKLVATYGKLPGLHGKVTTISDDGGITEEDFGIAIAYHNANDGIQSSVRKLLDVDDTTTPTPSP